MALIGRPAGAQASDSMGQQAIPVASWLEVTPGASCLSRDRLEELVAMWLARPRVTSHARVHVRGEASRPRAAELTVARDGQVSTRRFDPLPAGCDEAHAAVSLVIALAIEPTVIDGVLPQSHASRHELQAALTAQLAVASALLPSWALGGAVGLELSLAQWLGARAELMLQHARDNTVGDTPGAFDATLVAGDLRGCAGGEPSSALRIALCTGAALGVVHARGRNYVRSYAPTGPWLGVMTGVRLEIRWGMPWVLDVTAVLPLHAEPFTVVRAGQDVVSEQPNTAALIVALGAKLPL